MVRLGAALLKRRIEAAKGALDVSTVAQDLLREAGIGLEIKKKGSRWRGVCPLCNHGQHSDAFSCQEDLFHCYACGAGGDVVKLAQLACGFQTAAEAVAWLAFRYGLELPERPGSWYARQDRQARVRRQIAEKRATVFRRRLFRIVMVPILSATGATEEEAKAAWEDFQNVRAEELFGGK